MSGNPSQEEQRAFYDKWNRDSRSGRYEEVDRRVTVRTDRALEIVASLGLPRDAKILEVGCGTGWLSERLAAFGKVTGVDLSPEAIEIARSRGLDAEFIAGDFLALDLARFAGRDLVVCAETLFYVEDQAAFIEAIASVLAPGAHAIFTMINAFVYERSEDVPPPAPGQIRTWLRRGELLRLLRPHFQVQQMCSLEPMGHVGVLRLVNSPRLNGLLERVIPRPALTRAKERLGLGSGFVIACTRR